MFYPEKSCQWLSDLPVYCFQTNRQGGVSQGDFHSFNLAAHVGDDLNHVSENRHRLSRALNLPSAQMVFADQVHGNRVVFVEDHLPNHNTGSWPQLDSCDGLLTSQQQLCLIIQTADCVPVLLFDAKNGVIGAFHAGWRGVANQIVKNGIETIQKRYIINPSQLFFYLGPSIGQCCYETGFEVVEDILANTPNPSDWLLENERRYYVDLRKAIKNQLLGMDVPMRNAKISTACTSCQPTDFFSYRREGQTGRQCTGILLP
jgi:YfiH family protein